MRERTGLLPLQTGQEFLVTGLDHRVDAHNVVAVAREQGLAISRPRERQALGLLRVLAEAGELGLDLVDNRLALEVKDLDARGSRSAQPVAVRRKDEGIDNVAGLKRIEVLAVGKLPKHGNAVLAARSAERAIRRNGHRVDVALVAVVVGGELAAAELPHLLLVCSGQRHSAILVDILLIVQSTP